MPSIPSPSGDIAALLKGYSIEVIPRTAAKIERFADLLPPGTRVTIAEVEGTPFRDMVATASRVREEGFEPMPHVTARTISSAAMLSDRLAAYADAGVCGALVIAGGAREAAGPFEGAVDLLRTGLFEAHGFSRLHVAGHPEGNRDVDRDGSGTALSAALRAKADYARRTSAAMALVTQFSFDPAAITGWIAGLREAGITLPVHVGVPGPTKLQTLLRFAALCGVGPSISVLQKRARDLTHLMRPFEPTAILEALARTQRQQPGTGVETVHFFPFGGVERCAKWANARIAERVT